jgi:dihydrofolate reductase
LRGDAAEEVTALKAQPGRPIFLVGSSDLAQYLMQADLIDAYQLWVHPVVLGAGKRLFRDGSPSQALELVDVRATSLGIVIQNFRRSRP